MAEERSIEDLVDAALFGQLELTGWDAEFEQVLARINLVCVVVPELGFPPFGEGGRRLFLETVFAATKLPEQVEVGAELGDFIGADRRLWLDEIAPKFWSLPDGSKVSIEYSGETDPGEGLAYSPLVRVGLKALTDVDYHPFVCEGKVAVRLCLTDEQDRVIQETLDWPEVLSAGLDAG
jgi:hypothetical protein